MTHLKPLHKGIITGILMVVITLLLYYTHQPGNSPLQFLAYAIYAGGIIWTVLSYSRTEKFTGKFGELFGQGFRCFIIVTLIMVAFTYIFSMMHPELAEEAAAYYREALIKEKNTLPDKIDEMVDQAKKQYTTTVVSITIFRYLIIGALFTAAASGGLILTRRKE